MSSTDRSQTERIRRMRSKVQAVRRAECPSCLEEGPIGPVDQSTRVSRKFGQMVYYRQNAVGVVTAESCCTTETNGTLIEVSCGQGDALLLPNVVSFRNISGQDISIKILQGLDIIYVDLPQNSTIGPYINIDGYFTSDCPIIPIIPVNDFNVLLTINQAYTVNNSTSDTSVFQSGIHVYTYLGNGVFV